MRPAPPKPSGGGSYSASDFVQTVLFTDNESLIEAERINVYNKVDLEDDLVIIDNGQVMKVMKVMKVINHQLPRGRPSHQLPSLTMDSDWIRRTGCRGRRLPGR